jgi:predicted nucleic acid-binding protein
MPCVVADTSPLFYLAKLGCFTLLRDLFEKVNVPGKVWRETLAATHKHPETLRHFDAAKSDGWLVVRELQTTLALTELGSLDAGEREAITLAHELHADLLIVDDEAGRNVATNMGFAVTETLGVLINAKQHGLLSALRPAINRLCGETTFRISSAVIDDALRRAGEAP